MSRLGGNATAWTDVAIAALPFKAITMRSDQSSLGTGGA
jgi:hypothetical protein